MNPEHRGGGLVCPDCAQPLTGTAPGAPRPERCTSCGLPLVGPLAARLWMVDHHIATFREERRLLIRGLRDQASTVPPPPPGTPTRSAAHPGLPTGLGTATQSGLPPQSGSPTQPGLPPQPPSKYVYPAAQRPRQEWSRRRVQNLLLSLGVLLLAVSAIIFIAVNWGVLGAAGRAAVMAAVTLLTGAGAMLAARRRLPATAESVAALTLALLAVDATGLRLTSFSRTSLSASSYTAFAIVAIVGVAAAWLRVLPVRPLRFAVAVGPQCVLPLAFATTVLDAHRPYGVAAGVLAGQAAALVGLRHALRGREQLDPFTLRALRFGTAAAGLLAILAALSAGYEPRQFSLAGPVVLLVLAGVAIAAVLLEERRDIRDALLATATAATLLAAGTVVPHLAAPWRWPAVEALAFGAAVLLLAVPGRWRQGPELVVIATGAGAALTATRAVLEALVEPAGELGHVWARTWPDVRTLRAADLVRDLNGGAASPSHWVGTTQTGLLLFGALLTTLTLAARSRFAGLRLAAVPLAAVSLLLLPLEADLTVPGAVAWDMTLGSAVLLVAVRTGRTGALTAHLAAATGVFFLLHGTAWSLQSPVLTVMTVAVLLAVGLAVAVVGPEPYRVAAVAAASVLTALEASLVARYQGASTPQVGLTLAATAALLLIGGILATRRTDGLTPELPQAVALLAGLIALCLAYSEPAATALTFAILIAAIIPAVLLGGGHLEPAWSPVLQVLICLEVSALLHWGNPDMDGAHRSLAVATAAGVMAVAAPWLRKPEPTANGAHPRHPAIPALLTAPILYTLALVAVITYHRAGVLWPALLAGGVSGGVATSLAHLRKQHPDPVLRIAAATSAALLLASSWVRLAESHIHSVEPYTLPSALLLIAFGHLRRRRDETARSWPCYGPGLLLGLVPTLIQALADPGLVRPALVGAAALTVLLAGARQRLQAPLAIGASVLAVDALAQLSPFLASAYHAVPRWALIAAAGALLLGLGATYERRLRDLRLLRLKFAELR